MSSLIPAVALLAVQQLPGTIQGTVTDRATRHPLEHVTARLERRERLERLAGPLASTDTTGRFVLRDVPAGTHTIRVTRIGYAPALVHDVVVGPGRPAIVAVEMDHLDPGVIALEGIVVGASTFARPADVATTSYTLAAEEIRRSPGALGDVNRLVQSLPGVVTANDQRNDVIARGGSPIENLTLVDGIEIPNLNHFAAQNSSGGPISMLNTEFVREATFLAGGFPAEYGNRVSSVLDIRLREGRTDRVRTEGDVSFAGAGLIAEGPLTSRGSFLASARQSYLNLLAGPFGLTAIPYTTNWQAKATFATSARDTYELTTIGGRDDITFRVDDSNLDDPSMQRIASGGWRYATGFRWQRLFGAGVGTLTVSDAFDSFRTDVNDHQIGDRLVFRNRSGEAETAVRYDLSLRFAPRTTMKAGLVSKQFRESLEIDQPIGMQDPFSTDSARTNALHLDRKLDSNAPAGYVEVVQGIASNADLTVGVRAERFGFIDANAVSPRAGLVVRVARKWEVSASAGRYHQQPPLVYAAAYPMNASLEPIRADHFVAGLAFLASPSLRITAEVYRKNYEHYPVSIERPTLSLANTGDVFGVGGLLMPLASRGTGRAQGVELYAQQKLASHVYGQISYSSSSTEHAALDGVLRRGAFDTPQSATAILGYKIGERWELSGRFSYATGRPFTPMLEAVAREQNRMVYDLSRVNAERAPAYHRLDVRMDRRYSIGGAYLTSFLSINNVYNRENVFQYTWNPKTRAREALAQIKFLPVGGLKIEF